MVLPAYAGMIRRCLSGPASTSRAPRVCGDDPTNPGRAPYNASVLPAYAGMIRLIDPILRRQERAPRVCGDDPHAGNTEKIISRCSPRMRG